MKKYKKILVALDGSKADDNILDFVNKYASVLSIERVIGFHVIPSINIGTLSKIDNRKSLNIVSSSVEAFRLAFETQMKKLNENLSWDLRLKEGQPYKELIDLVDEVEPDLLIMGQKKVTSGSGITTKLVARNIDADVLSIPEDFDCADLDIVAPVDFSENAYRSLMIALSLTDEGNLQKPLDVLTVVKMPEPSLYQQAEYTDVQSEIMKYAMEDFEDFIGDYDLNPSVFKIAFEETTQKISTTILDFAANQNKNLIMVGAKGHGFLERLVLGSTTENLLNQLEHQALWIVR